MPWKYGYKSAKSLVRIELTEERPKTFWNSLNPKEYGFYSNVDPAVAHPRWSQATERLLDSGERVPMLPFTGYGDSRISIQATPTIVRDTVEAAPMLWLTGVG